ncbi:hypothetical protein OR1_02481 [Geobacter sp. OR-1]|uniref:UPF0489 family protein n=1 Tax=Geobacter sp. OR-1 TaxID=1266765 RepID=UPI0005437321|nr:UPF0489 family protein [Geobacter sp. OR-1]GAM10193.1 hypothetical protein OR1_02481 [Geobacter sp. OR-1]
MRTKTAVVAVIILVISMAIVAICFTKKADSGDYPILGTDMLTGVSVVENHREALKVWAEKGIKDAVLVNLDAHDDLRMVPQSDMKKLKRLYQSKQLGERGSVACQEGYGPVTNANFIHAAAKLGIVKRVVWVVPASYALFSDDGERLQALLKMYGFTRKEIAGFRIKRGCFSGKTGGIPLTICDAASLPEIEEPILLSIDADFFPAELAEEVNRITEPVKETFKALFAKSYKVSNAVVAHSVNGGFTEASRRWIGELATDSIRLPGVTRMAELPARYEFLQKADHLLTLNRHRELMDLLSPVIAKGVDDPSVLLYASLASQGMGRDEEAFVLAEQACLRDKRFSYGLTQVGTLVLGQHGLQRAERFFTKGYELSPGMDDGQFMLGMELKKAGRHDEAIRYFNRFRHSYGPFPVDFYIAETMHQQGDQRNALRYYDSGRKELARNPAALAGFGDLRVIEGAATFFERNGNTAVALELRNAVRSRNN